MVIFIVTAIQAADGMINRSKSNIKNAKEIEVNTMFYKLKIIFFILTFSLIGSAGFAADIYVDQTLSQNITDGKYSIANRNNSGSDGNAYTTIQAAVNAMNGGDDIYLRGGTYSLSGSTVEIPATADGTEANWSSIQSYPGEWAILDGENNVTGYHGVMLGAFGTGGDAPRAYWKFERLELTRGGNSEAYAPIWMNYGPIIVRYCYIHDNTCSRAGLYNAGGVKGKAWHNSIIEYNYFYNNGGTNDDYGSDICIYSDYVADPTQVNINLATHKNTIRYNYFVDSQQAIKYKNFQSLSLDNSGNHTTYKDYGDNIHHNIIINASRDQHFSQDFVQLHHNIFDNCGIIRTQEVNDDPRERFYSTVYNNLFLRTRFSVSRNNYAGIASNYRVPEDYGDLHPHAYVCNNISEDVSGLNDGRRDFSIFFIYKTGLDWENQLNWNTVTVENNLFYGDTQDDNVFKVYQNDYSVNGFESAGYATINYATTNPGLHPTGEKYKINGTFELGRNNKTIADGGFGKAHPYLSGINIPSYLGVCDPSKDSGSGWAPNSPNPDDAGWIDYVLSLQNIDTLKGYSTIGSPLPPPTWPSQPFSTQ